MKARAALVGNFVFQELSLVRAVINFRRAVLVTRVLVKLHQPIQIRPYLLLHIFHLVVLPAKNSTPGDTELFRELRVVKTERFSVDRNPLTKSLATLKRNVPNELNDTGYKSDFWLYWVGLPVGNCPS